MEEDTHGLRHTNTVNSFDESENNKWSAATAVSRIRLMYCTMIECSLIDKICYASPMQHASSIKHV